MLSREPTSAGIGVTVRIVSVMIPRDMLAICLQNLHEQYVGVPMTARC